MMEKLLEIFGDLPQASTVAARTDALYDFIFWISLVSFVIIVGGMTYFVWKYHRSRVPPDKTPYLTGYAPLEIGVSVGLLVLVMVIFYWGWIDYKKLVTPPKDSLEVNVIGRQWMWEFEYLNGRKLTGELVVPLQRDVKLVMSSADVLHSFYVPAFRVKQDVVPGTYTEVWFQATQLGEHQVFCAEYCGTAHSKMLAKVKVVDAQEYEHWQRTWEFARQMGIQTAEGAAQETLPERGKRLFAEKGCMACHSVDGTAVVGPSLKGVFGHEVELADGTKVMADENYVRESIMDPTLKLVKGFQPLMPTYRGTLQDDEINAIVAYIKSLGK